MRREVLNDSDLGRLTGRGLYPPRFAWALLNPLRNVWLSPRKLARRLKLEENSIVLEIGCGPGYFSTYLAKKVPKGKLYLTDIQPEMVKKARNRLTRRRITNVDLRVCDGKRLDYPDATFDRIFLVTVLGEISDRSLYAKEMYRILRTGGIVSVSEQKGDPDALSLDEVRSILGPAGFELTEIFGKGMTYTANFTKTASKHEAGTGGRS